MEIAFAIFLWDQRNINLNYWKTWYRITIKCVIPEYTLDTTYCLNYCLQCIIVALITCVYLYVIRTMPLFVQMHIFYKIVASRIENLCQIDVEYKIISRRNWRKWSNVIFELMCRDSPLWIIKILLVDLLQFDR